MNFPQFLMDHVSKTRRHFLRCGAVGVAALGVSPIHGESRKRSPQLQKALDALETWLTNPDEFRDVSRGTHCFKFSIAVKTNFTGNLISC